MRLTRFCSQAEYDAFMRGEVLHNTTDQKAAGWKSSTAKGFCFSVDPPKVAWRYLKAIVDCDVCMVLYIDESLLTKATAKYPDYSSGQMRGHCIKTEYCMESYSKDSAKLLEVLRPGEFAPMQEVMLAKIIQPFVKPINPEPWH